MLSTLMLPSVVLLRGTDLTVVIAIASVVTPVPGSVALGDWLLGVEKASHTLWAWQDKNRSRVGAPPSEGFAVKC